MDVIQKQKEEKLYIESTRVAEADEYAKNRNRLISPEDLMIQQISGDYSDYSEKLKELTQHTHEKILERVEVEGIRENTYIQNRVNMDTHRWSSKKKGKLETSNKYLEDAREVFKKIEKKSKKAGFKAEDRISDFEKAYDKMRIADRYFAESVSINQAQEDKLKRQAEKTYFSNLIRYYDSELAKEGISQKQRNSLIKKKESAESKFTAIIEKEAKESVAAFEAKQKANAEKLKKTKKAYPENDRINKNTLRLEEKGNKVLKFEKNYVTKEQKDALTENQSYDCTEMLFYVRFDETGHVLEADKAKHEMNQKWIKAHTEKVIDMDAVKEHLNFVAEEMISNMDFTYLDNKEKYIENYEKIAQLNRMNINFLNYIRYNYPDQFEEFKKNEPKKYELIERLRDYWIDCKFVLENDFRQRDGYDISDHRIAETVPRWDTYNQGFINERKAEVQKSLNELKAAKAEYDKEDKYKNQNEAFRLRVLLNDNRIDESSVEILNAHESVEKNKKHYITPQVREQLEKVLAENSWGEKAVESMVASVLRIVRFDAKGNPLTDEDKKNDIWNKKYIESITNKDVAKREEALREAMDYVLSVDLATVDGYQKPENILKDFRRFKSLQGLASALERYIAYDKYSKPVMEKIKKENPERYALMSKILSCIDTLNRIYKKHASQKGVDINAVQLKELQDKPGIVVYILNSSDKFEEEYRKQIGEAEYAKYALDNKEFEQKTGFKKKMPVWLDEKTHAIDMEMKNKAQNLYDNKMKNEVDEKVRAMSSKDDIFDIMVSLKTFTVDESRIFADRLKEIIEKPKEYGLSKEAHTEIVDCISQIKEHMIEYAKLNAIKDMQNSLFDGNMIAENRESSMPLLVNYIRVKFVKELYKDDNRKLFELLKKYDIVFCEEGTTKEMIDSYKEAIDHAFVKAGEKGFDFDNPTVIEKKENETVIEKIQRELSLGESETILLKIANSTQLDALMSDETKKKELYDTMKEWSLSIKQQAFCQLLFINVLDGREELDNLFKKVELDRKQFRSKVGDKTIKNNIGAAILIQMKDATFRKNYADGYDKLRKMLNIKYSLAEFDSIAFEIESIVPITEGDYIKAAEESNYDYQYVKDTYGTDDPSIVSKVTELSYLF